ncbi:MAG: lipid A-modifier LpxR family protein [bacterium]
MMRHTIMQAAALLLAVSPHARSQQVDTIPKCVLGDAPPGVDAKCPDARAAATLKYGHTFGLFFEEDNLQLQFHNTHTDRNYTLGLGLQWSGEIEQHGLDKPLRWLNRRIGLDDLTSATAAPETGMLSGTAFSPRDISANTPVVGDRPWAFLLGWTVRRTQPSISDAWSTELTLGTIGSPLGQWVQRSIHYSSRHLSGSQTPYNPQGWPHQLLDSPLGAPTARYALTYERVLIQQSGGAAPLLLRGVNATPDLKHHFEIAGNAEGQAGYYTEADAGGTLRIGSFTTPFWQFRSNPLGVVSRKATVGGSRNEWFAFLTGTGRAVAYNALLTGYGDNRFTDYHMRNDEVQHTIGEASYGAAFTHIRPNGSAWMVTWIMDAFRTHEFNTTPEFVRAHHWGGFMLTWVNP